MYSQKTNPKFQPGIHLRDEIPAPVRKAITLVFLIFLCFSAKTKASGIDTNWVKYADTSGVTVYYQITTCDSATAVIINFTNSNSYDVKIEWEDQIKAFGNWINTTGSTSKSIVVGQGDTTSEDCNASDPQCLISGKIWLSIPDYAVTDFQLSSIKITRQ